jgi:hypothetical protein
MYGRILVSLALCCLPSWGTRAQQPATTAYPQWTTTFSREELAFDYIASLQGPSWVRLPDGDVVLVTSTGTSEGSALLMRRFATDGSVRASHLETLLGPASTLFRI